MATYCVQFFFGRRYNLQPLSPWTRDPCHGSTFAIRESEKYGMKEDTIYPSVVPRTSAPFSPFRWVYDSMLPLVRGKKNMGMRNDFSLGIMFERLMDEL